MYHRSLWNCFNFDVYQFSI